MAYPLNLATGTCNERLKACLFERLPQLSLVLEHPASSWPVRSGMIFETSDAYDGVSLSLNQPSLWRKLYDDYR